ncbi:hypothetical protein CVD25_13625 [Bacillus canaveralius]|uniref:Molecular chaperone TorD n=1 Tax=Bacillus canaveralius TaxID=1403243 RepID=A0A2N5GQ10_9BACI|nr:MULTISPECIES: hypothetical protein [Bacillus]PLR83657.1 hypothetical protein CVD23_13545 [Bacillus sp. V33-4]PLR84921.1 hypothetical protein CU635_05380 [Bacillus canaveralius]PLR95823.1 hypothetical protein CVD25_13625 [Bacillus canaveralius]
MIRNLEELHGKLALANILTSVWLGDWDRYEEIFNDMPNEIRIHFPFHKYYDREEVMLWHENHFSIPGDYFVSPYFSSYGKREGEEEDDRKQDLLCLIGLFEKTGFYYPLEKERYPDHLGCLTAFLSSVLLEQIKSAERNDHQYLGRLINFEMQIAKDYIAPVLPALLDKANEKISNLFLKEFLNFYFQAIRNDWIEAGAMKIISP